MRFVQLESGQERVQLCAARDRRCFIVLEGSLSAGLDDETRRFISEVDFTLKPPGTAHHETTDSFNAWTGFAPGLQPCEMKRGPTSWTKKPTYDNYRGVYRTWTTFARPR